MRVSESRTMPVMLEILASGILGGLVGGVLWALLLMFVYAGSGAGFWTPMQAVAAAFVGPTAFASSAAILLGIAAHLFASMVWGVLFGILAPRNAPWGTAMVGGLIAGVLTILPMTWGVLASFDPVMFDQVGAIWGAWLVAHVFFGVGLGFVPAFRRWMAGVPEPRAPSYDAAA
jgi:hypothetical protein